MHDTEIAEENNTYSSGTKTHETIKYLDVMDLLETQPIILRIIMNMAGLEKKNIDGEIVFVREFQPNYTDEYTKQIGTTLMFHANQVTSYTCLTEDSIRTYIRNRMHAEIERIFTIGRDNHISQDSWRKILEIHKKKITRKIPLYKEGKKVGHKEIEVSGWYDIINKDWKPESIITQQMLKHVKDPLERGDYNTIAKALWLDIYSFIKSALYLSREIEGGFGNLQAHSQNSQRVVNQNIVEPIRKPSVFQKIRNRFGSVGRSYS